jgi:hypothetical protein
MAMYDETKQGIASLFTRPAEAFILGSAILSLLGWTLALVHQLKPAPYAVGMIVSIGLWVGLGKQWILPRASIQLTSSRIRKRLCRPVFVVYTVILLASLAGGLLYAPSNYDALSYRTPQLLHWLDHGGWHWIETPNSRMNIAPPGSNWLTAPFIVLLRTDRLSFVINIAAFAFLPGFLFELFRRAGVKKRVAWWWMWLLPSGYVFAMQAGGLGNDLTGAVYAAAAIAFALRARDHRHFEHAALSLIAVALCTGIKNVNIPLILPWAVALGGGWQPFAARPFAGAAVALLAGVSSCLPTTLLNLQQTGHWTGDPNDTHRVRQPNPWVGGVSNSVVLAIANLQPPLLPAAQRVNDMITRGIDASVLGDICWRSPRFEAKWYELPSEESAGVGPGIAILAVICVLTSPFLHRRCSGLELYRQKLWGVGITSLVALLVPVCLMSSEGIPRLIAPFVPSTLLLGLFACDQTLARYRIWRVMAVVAASLPIPGLVLSPARPLFPQSLILGRTAKPRKETETFARARRVYSVYANRSDAFADLRTFLPKGTGVIGLIAFGDEPETSFWRPFGSISVRHLMRDSEVPNDLVIVASNRTLRSRFGMSVADFGVIHGLRILGSSELALRASGAPDIWYVMAPGK